MCNFDLNSWQGNNLLGIKALAYQFGDGSKNITKIESTIIEKKYEIIETK